METTNNRAIDFPRSNMSHQVHDLRSLMESNLSKSECAEFLRQLPKNVLKENKTAGLIFKTLTLITNRHAIEAYFEYLKDESAILGFAIQNCQFSDKAWLSFCKGFRTCDTVNIFFIDNCNMTNEHLQTFFEEGSPNKLVSLGFRQQEMDDTFLVILGSSLAAHKNIKDLKINNCNFTDGMVFSFANILERNDIRITFLNNPAMTEQGLTPLLNKHILANIHTRANTDTRADTGIDQYTLGNIQTFVRERYISCLTIKEQKLEVFEKVLKGCILTEAAISSKVSPIKLIVPLNLQTRLEASRMPEVAKTVDDFQKKFNVVLDFQCINQEKTQLPSPGQAVQALQDAIQKNPVNHDLLTKIFQMTSPEARDQFFLEWMCTAGFTRKESPGNSVLGSFVQTAYPTFDLTGLVDKVTEILNAIKKELRTNPTYGYYLEDGIGIEDFINSVERNGQWFGEIAGVATIKVLEREIKKKCIIKLFNAEDICKQKQITYKDAIPQPPQDSIISCDDSEFQEVQEFNIIKAGEKLFTLIPSKKRRPDIFSPDGERTAQRIKPTIEASRISSKINIDDIDVRDVLTGAYPNIEKYEEYFTEYFFNNFGLNDFGFSYESSKLKIRNTIDDFIITSPEAVAAIFRVLIKHFHNSAAPIKELKFVNCQLTREAWEVVWATCKILNIEALGFKECMLNKEMIQDMFAFDKDKNILRDLTIKDLLGCEPDFWDGLAEGMSGHNTLESIVLNNVFHLTSNEKELGNVKKLMQSLGSLRMLSFLTISRIPLGQDPDIKESLSILFKNAQLKYLKLSNSDINDEVLDHLTSILEEETKHDQDQSGPFKGLRDLIISFNPVTERAVLNLIKAKTNLLGVTMEGTASDKYEICMSLKGVNPALLSLNLGQLDLTNHTIALSEKDEDFPLKDHPLKVSTNNLIDPKDQFPILAIRVNMFGGELLDHSELDMIDSSDDSDYDYDNEMQEMIAKSSSLENQNPVKEAQRIAAEEEAKIIAEQQKIAESKRKALEDAESPLYQKLLEILKTYDPSLDLLKKISTIQTPFFRNDLFLKFLGHKFDIKNVPGNGDCFFTSLGVLLKSGEEIPWDIKKSYAKRLRKEIVDTIENSEEEIEVTEDTPEGPKLVKKRVNTYAPFINTIEFPNIKAYCQKMRRKGVWADQLELAATVKYLNEKYKSQYFILHVYDLDSIKGDGIDILKFDKDNVLQTFSELNYVQDNLSLSNREIRHLYMVREGSPGHYQALFLKDAEKHPPLPIEVDNKPLSPTPTSSSHSLTTTESLPKRVRFDSEAGWSHEYLDDDFVTLDAPRVSNLSDTNLIIPANQDNGDDEVISIIF